MEQKRNHVADIVYARPGCKVVIQNVLKNGYIKGDSEDRDVDSINVLVDANILAVIERKIMFHSRIVQRACEQMYAN